jgi:glutathione peroxidase
MRPIVLLLGLTLAASPSFAEEPAPAPGAQVLDHKMQDIDGKDADLAKYKGKVVMIVNVASKCGLTPQYEQLVKIYHEQKDRGFVVLGFPANNFMSQEPGTNEEIKEFCATTYEVDFPLFSKISVKDDDIHPLYKELTSEETNPGFAGEIAWNFTKFLVNREGRVVARFEPQTKPNDEEVLAAIKAELDKPAPSDQKG